MAKLVNAFYPIETKNRIFSHWHKPNGMSYLNVYARLPSVLIPRMGIYRISCLEDKSWYWRFGTSSSVKNFVSPQLAMKRADEYLLRCNFLLAKDEEEWNRWLVLV